MKAIPTRPGRVRPVPRLVAVGSAAVIMLAGCTPATRTGPGQPKSTGLTGSTLPVATATATATPSAAGNGIERLDGKSIVEASYRAAAAAKSVHLTGTYTASVEAFAQLVGTSPTGSSATGSPSTGSPAANSSASNEAPPRNSVIIDTRGSDTAFTATIIVGDLSAQVVRQQASVYLKGNDALATRLSRPQIVDHWARFAASDPKVKGFLALTAPVALLGAVLASKDQELRYVTGSDSTVAEGVGVQVLITEQDSLVGTAVIARTGSPVPLHVKIADATGTVDLGMTDWNAVVPIVTPAPAVEAS
jgi:hypothetical protein